MGFGLPEALVAPRGRDSRREGHAKTQRCQGVGGARGAWPTEEGRSPIAQRLTFQLKFRFDWLLITMPSHKS
jgi:hypothetical protein